MRGVRRDEDLGLSRLHQRKVAVPSFLDRHVKLETRFGEVAHACRAHARKNHVDLAVGDNFNDPGNSSSGIFCAISSRAVSPIMESTESIAPHVGEEGALRWVDVAVDPVDVARGLRRTCRQRCRSRSHTGIADPQAHRDPAAAAWRTRSGLERDRFARDALLFDHLIEPLRPAQAVLGCRCAGRLEVVGALPVVLALPCSRSCTSRSPIRLRG